jgi:TPR repeat protein
MAAALEWFIRAGSGRSLMISAQILFSGAPGVLQDRNRAVELLERSANSGFVDAALNLANMFGESPRGFPWLVKAAKGGSREAQEKLNRMQTRGPTSGGPRDRGRRRAAEGRGSEL